MRSTEPTQPAQGPSEQRGVGYVLAIGCDRRVSTPAGELRADGVAARPPKHVWQRLSAGAGAKGHRCYDWAFADIDERGGCQWLLIRRNRTTGELACYRRNSPEPVPLRVLVQVAGRRWTVEESFQVGKGLTGLDQHQVRRWTVMAMLATLSSPLSSPPNEPPYPRPPDGFR
ncbi:hypothetical protein BS329_20420 [Amycolatopsis coloradensis]|uniref:Transposase IS4-like domain-containing protein n=1 Tax=Amycolatopsis coloradensis TaxID=76021 RepID=A0A1R0KQN6_9PSEU|nr:hypothetical protein [Amycolatopsis coloradensis]OLZ50000.1 hypothetical protein BS329_20420 [Amycolatopsis coloradensis]